MLHHQNEKKQKNKWAAHSVNNEGFFQKKWILGPPASHEESGPKKLGQLLNIFGLQIAPKLVINARTLAPSPRLKRALVMCLKEKVK